jgi:hypothetical protein
MAQFNRKTAASILGSRMFEIDLLTDHELGIPGGVTPAATEAWFL